MTFSLWNGKNLLNFYELVFAGNMTKTKTLEIALSAVTGFLAFICIGVICIYSFRGRQEKYFVPFLFAFSTSSCKLENLYHIPVFLSDKQGSTEIRSRLMLRGMSVANKDAGESVELPLYIFREIATATNNFSDSTILGQGGFGTVYKVSKAFAGNFRWLESNLISNIQEPFVYSGNIGRQGNRCEKTLQRFWPRRSRVQK